MSYTSSSLSILNLIEQKLIQYIYPICLIIGITGCILNLIVFSRPKLRVKSCCIYFFAASADHLLTLIIGMGSIIYSLNNSDLQTNSLLFCKIRGYIFQITLMISRWFIAFASIDRYASCSTKIHRRNFAKTHIAYRIIIIIILTWSILCIHRLIFYEIHENLCGILTNTIAAIYHSLYVIIGGGILPTIIMIICTYLIHKTLVNQHKKRQNYSLKRYENNYLNRQVIHLLFIQIIFYIIFIIPQLFYLIFNTLSNTLRVRTKTHLIIERFINSLAELMLYMFPITSFYLYTLTSRTFRKELMKVFFRIRLSKTRAIITSHHKQTIIYLMRNKGNK